MQNIPFPAPAQTFQQMIVPANHETTRKIYATNEELIQDIGNGISGCDSSSFMKLAAATFSLMTVHGVRLLAMLQSRDIKLLGIDLEEVKAQLLAVNNLALEGKPAGHGHYTPTYAEGIIIPHSLPAELMIL